MAAKKKETFKTALRKYQRSPQDAHEDAVNARKLEQRDNAKIKKPKVK